MEEESKPAKKRRRNKKKNQQAPNPVADSSDASEPETTFEEELEWCVNQVLIDVTEGRDDPERFKQSQKVLRTLLGAKTALVAKRQLMKAAFGDYRHEMRTQQTLEQTRQKLCLFDITDIEERLGMKIPYRYESADTVDNPFRSGISGKSWENNPNASNKKTFSDYIGMEQKLHKLAVDHYEVARTFLAKGDTDEASQHFEMSVNCDLEYIPPRYELMKILLDVDDNPKKALVEAQKIWEIDRNFMQPTFARTIIPDIIKKLDKKKENTKRVPVTIITGFLGSGKTTLLNRILSEPHGHRIAVIENEFGAVGVDEKLVVANKYEDEQIIEIINGCVCCTVRDDLATTLTDMKSKYVDTDLIDYIILETTGMADPGPVLSTFLLHTDIQEWFYVDACVTVADGTQIVAQLEDDREEGCENEAVEQVCFADKVLLNKIDLCSEEQLEGATKKMREYNTQVSISRVQLNDKQIPFDELLNQKAFDLERALELDETLVQQDAFEDHKHDSRIGTFSYRMEAEMSEESASAFLNSIVQKGPSIYRMKGFLAVKDQEFKFVFHSVGMNYELEPLDEWKPDEKRECLIVIIGKYLQQSWLEEKILEAALTKPKHLEQIPHPQDEETQNQSEDKMTE